MDFGELTSSALDHELGTDDSTRLFTTGRRNRAINRGHFEFCDLTECLTRQSTMTCSNGVGEYNLISTVILSGGDFLRLSAQMPEYYLVSSGTTNSTTWTAGPDLFPRHDLPWLNQYDQDWRGSTGATPQAHYLRADGGRLLFGLAPPPRITSSQAGRVIFPYIAKPSTMTASTDLPFTVASTARTDLEPYQMALVHYAAGTLEKLRKNQEGGAAQMQQFLGYVQRYLLAQRPPGGQTLRFVRNYLSERRDRKSRDNWVTAQPFPWRT